jgi:uncharacterized protein (TIGR02118 family)
LEQLAVGVWRALGTASSDCHAALLGEWAHDALDHAAVESLVVNVADADQGVYAQTPDARGLVGNVDALLVLGLERAHDLDDLPARDLLHHVARRVDVWRVQTHLRKGDEPVATRPGEPTPGVKLVAFMRRVEGLSHEQFVRYWTERHALLAIEHRPSMSRYVQHVVRRAYTPGGRDVDGIAELVFGSRDEFDDRFRDREEARRIVNADLARFARRDWSEAAVMIEHVLRSAVVAPGT